MAAPDRSGVGDLPRESARDRCRGAIQAAVPWVLEGRSASSRFVPGLRKPAPDAPKPDDQR